MLTILVPDPLIAFGRISPFRRLARQIADRNGTGLKRHTLIRASFSRIAFSNRPLSSNCDSQLHREPCHLFLERFAVGFLFGCTDVAAWGEDVVVGFDVT